jgi:hypothetical protein
MATRNRKAVNDQAAQQLQAGLRRLGNFEHVSVHAQRGHLVVVSGDDTWPVARLTPLGGDHYGLSFHRHDGRWEPMPFSGPLDDVATTLVTTLAPYLQPVDFPSEMSGSDH